MIDNSSTKFDGGPEIVSVGFRFQMNSRVKRLIKEEKRIGSRKGAKKREASQTLEVQSRASARTKMNMA